MSEIVWQQEGASGLHHTTAFGRLCVVFESPEEWVFVVWGPHGTSGGRSNRQSAQNAATCWAEAHPAPPAPPLPQRLTDPSWPQQPGRVEVPDMPPKFRA